MNRPIWPLGISLCIVGCSSSAPGVKAGAESLGDRSTEETRATSAPLASTVPSAVEIANRQSVIRSYFASRVAELHAVATTRTSHNTIVDWVPAGVTAPPPPPMTPCTTFCAPTELQVEVAAQGPRGTVPIVRFDVEAYLAKTPVPPASPEDVLPKKSPPSTRVDLLPRPSAPATTMPTGYTTAGAPGTAEAPESTHGSPIPVSLIAPRASPRSISIAAVPRAVASAAASDKASKSDKPRARSSISTRRRTSSHGLRRTTGALRAITSVATIAPFEAGNRSARISLRA